VLHEEFIESNANTSGDRKPAASLLARNCATTLESPRPNPQNVSSSVRASEVKVDLVDLVVLHIVSRRLRDYYKLNIVAGC
jgi:ribosomal silencing factor RsfS